MVVCGILISADQIKAHLVWGRLAQVEQAKVKLYGFYMTILSKVFLHVSSPIRYSKRKKISEVKYIGERLHTALY